MEGGSQARCRETIVGGVRSCIHSIRILVGIPISRIPCSNRGGGCRGCRHGIEVMLERARVGCKILRSHLLRTFCWAGLRSDHVNGRSRVFPSAVSDPDQMRCWEYGCWR